MITDIGLFDDPRLTAMGLLAETFAGLQAKIVPALAETGLSVTDFDVLLRLARSEGQRLRMIAWHDGPGVYWLVNTLSNVLSNRQMLAIAGAAKRS